ncbi:MAG TPA: ATP-binding cassette domain-containing protein [Verrucomicrobiales bacterium]|nr:ATP-binding cassette domain-containing protein [Verrucomicrobiales bacterium]
MKEVDLQIQSGRIVGLLGANGSGKSTLIRHFIGLYLSDQGECLTFDTPSKDLGPNQLARIGYVHQEGELPDWISGGFHADTIYFRSVHGGGFFSIGGLLHTLDR